MYENFSSTQLTWVKSAILAATGLLDGVTTNPSLVAKTGRDFFEVVAEICDLVDGPVSAEVTALDADGMLAEAERLTAIADNVCVKVPLTLDGLRACRTLTDAGKMVNVTLCFLRQPGLIGGEGGRHVHFAFRRGASTISARTVWS